MTGTDGATLDEIASALVAEVQAAGPARGLKGSQAGTLLRLKFPSFSPKEYGARSLRQFIDKHVPAVKMLAGFDTDPVYGLADWAPPQPETATSVADLWRIWVSPTSRYQLLVDRQSGHVRSAQIDASAKAAETSILPAAPDLHRLMAREFLTTERGITPSLLPELAATANAPHPLWWKDWQNIIKLAGTEVTQHWFDHRKRVLESALRTALAEAGLGEATASAAYTAITKSHLQKDAKARREFLVAAPPQGVPPAQDHLAASSPRTTTTDLCEFVKVIVSKMSTAELRDLRLPLGLVLDAMGESHVQR